MMARERDGIRRGWFGWRKAAGAGAIACCALVACGCPGAADFSAAVSANRDAAFEAWRRAHAGEPTDQPTVKGDLSLASAQLLAMGNNKQLRAILEEKNIAEGQVTEAWSEALPKLTFTGAYQRLDRVAGLDAGPVTVTMGDKDNYSLGLMLSQPIFRGGAIGAGIRAATLYQILADEQVRGVVQSVLYETRKAYYGVLLSQELVKVSEDDLQRVRRHLADVEKKRAQEVATEFDALRARVEVSNVEAELIERQNALRLAGTSLLKTLGVSQESRVTFTDRLVHEPVQADMASAVSEAFRQRPELLQAELGVKLQGEAVAAARAGWWPTVDAYFSETYARPDPHSMTNIAWDDAWNAGATVSWPIFDGFRTAGRVRQENARLRKQRIGLLDTEELVLLEVRQALLSIEDAEKLVRSQSANREQAREGLRLAEVGYREGVTTEVEVLDARQALSTTQALYFKALHSHMTARLLLERATGSLEPPGKGVEK